MKAQLIHNTNDDLFVANVARVSFDKWNTELDLSLNKSGKPKDPSLINYLASHYHLSPFWHIRFTMEFPSTEAIPLYAITDPTYLMGATWKVANGKFKFRTSFYGWVKLITDKLIHPDYLAGVVNPLLNNSKIKYSCIAYNLHNYSLNEQYDDNWLFTDNETDENFIDASVRFEVPIFIARQLVKHRMFAMNEVSRRYVSSLPEFYKHQAYRKRPDGSIKQGSSLVEQVTDLACFVTELPNERVFSALDPAVDTTSTAAIVDAMHQLSATLYSSLIHARVAPEQARGILLQDMYTSFVFTGSLVAWSRLIHERTYSGAQLEIQDVANQAYAQLVAEYPQFEQLHQSTKRS